MAILGIDLGTTNSLGAVYRNGKVELIPNRFGSFLTPSVVSVTEDGSVVTGQIAKERLITHPKDTAFSFKKNMGSDQKYNLGGKTFLPEELSGFIVSAIVEDAKAYLGEEIKDVIISVPAYFHDKQRVATKRAGALAGVNVKRIVNEPSAAALASYFDTQNEQLFLVFDFGGGTLDVSIVDCFDTMVDILAVSGDNHLGGDDFNEAVAEGFLREHQLQRGNLSENDCGAWRTDISERVYKRADDAGKFCRLEADPDGASACPEGQSCGSGRYRCRDSGRRFRKDAAGTVLHGAAF